MGAGRERELEDLVCDEVVQRLRRLRRKPTTRGIGEIVGQVVREVMRGGPCRIVCVVHGGDGYVGIRAGVQTVTRREQQHRAEVVPIERARAKRAARGKA